MALIDDMYAGCVVEVWYDDDDPYRPVPPSSKNATRWVGVITRVQKSTYYLEFIEDHIPGPSADLEQYEVRKGYVRRIERELHIGDLVTFVDGVRDIRKVIDKRTGDVWWNLRLHRKSGRDERAFKGCVTKVEADHIVVTRPCGEEEAISREEIDRRVVLGYWVYRSWKSAKLHAGDRAIWAPRMEEAT